MNNYNVSGDCSAQIFQDSSEDLRKSDFQMET